MKNYLKAFFIIVGILIIAALPIASAQSGHAEYTYMIGTGFLAAFGPVISMADNGDTIELAGEGTLSIHPKSVTGEGTFIHRDSSGNIIATGTWTATKLQSFNSYGDATPQGLPSDFEGGMGLIRVHISPAFGGPGFDGVLQVDCTLGDKIPTSATEGITLAVQDGLNFNNEISGATLFIRTA